MQLVGIYTVTEWLIVQCCSTGWGKDLRMGLKRAAHETGIKLQQDTVNVTDVSDTIFWNASAAVLPQHSLVQSNCCVALAAMLNTVTLSAFNQTEKSVSFLLNQLSFHSEGKRTKARPSSLIVCNRNLTSNFNKLSCSQMLLQPLLLILTSGVSASPNASRPLPLNLCLSFAPDRPWERFCSQPGRGSWWGDPAESRGSSLQYWQNQQTPKGAFITALPTTQQPKADGLEFLLLLLPQKFIHKKKGIKRLKISHLTPLNVSYAAWGCQTLPCTLQV